MGNGAEEDHEAEGVGRGVMLTVHQGHTLESLRQIPDASVQCVVTSPPYWGLRDYGTKPVDWPAVSYEPMPGIGCTIEVDAGAASLGLEPTLNAFIGHLVAIFREVRRVLKDDGVCWVNMGDGYASNGGHADKDCNDRRGARNIANRPEHEQRDFRAKQQPDTCVFMSTTPEPIIPKEILCSICGGRALQVTSSHSRSSKLFGPTYQCLTRGTHMKYPDKARFIDIQPKQEEQS